MTWHAWFGWCLTGHHSRCTFRTEKSQCVCPCHYEAELEEIL